MTWHMERGRWIPMLNFPLTEGVVRILLGKLGDFLPDKYVLLTGFGHEIHELKDDLESMNACLRDLATAGDYDQSKQVRILDP
ncbi:hypothetical protein E2562_014348 [Oryza meyeriana var. granulata]|uniref:Disease resistance N-terminal domain-containing protein n=1 Tax=Oryza meyeriana var. granulata TaxID=110450 RepID=A0A6G1C662_9ORYZ|nr:hypothetical protein E2562_014348 [Oryza meyeriana var. granulata]